MGAIRAMKDGEMELAGLSSSGIPHQEAVLNVWIGSLKEMAQEILKGATVIEGILPRAGRSSFKLYDEMRRFEIDLIKQALLHTGGHQRRAAQLLGVKFTTLHSKIKRYKIQEDLPVNGKLGVSSDELDERDPRERSS